MPAAEPDREAALDALRAAFGPRLLTGESILSQHDHDESGHPPARADAVFFPETTEDAAKAVAICRDHHLPIVPFGTGSGQEGGAIPVEGGLVIATARLDRIHEINLQDRDCLVGAGVPRLTLEAALRGTGLTFPIDPGADASLGGMAATGAAGTASPLYGTMHDNVLGLEIVTADGTIVTTGSRARKNSSGYDLTRLLVGSEGTLGLITKVRLKLHALPEGRLVLRASFPGSAAAVGAVAALLMAGLPLARAEFMDAAALRGLRKAGLTDLPELPTVLIELHGAPASLAEIAELVETEMDGAGGKSLARAVLTEEITALWTLRHNLVEGEKQLRPGARVIVTDAAVPVSRVPELLAAAETELQERGLAAVVSGHLADGNLHHALLVDAADPAEMLQAQLFKEWLAERAVALGGVISGEHGIGLGKRKHMAVAHGPALNMMRQVKSALDPLGIMNPGKVLPG